MFDSKLNGKRVKLLRMEDPYTDLKEGDMGTIKGVDDLGQILVNWDSGSTLSLIPDIDEYKIEESKVVKFFEFVLNDNDLDYVKVKLQELIDLFKDEYNVGVDVKIFSDNIKFQVGLDDDAFIFNIDLERMMLYKSFSYGVEGKPEDVHKDEEWSFENIDEAFDILEKQIHKILRISESKNHTSRVKSGTMNMTHRKNIIRKAKELIKKEIKGYKELSGGKQESILDEYIGKVCKSMGFEFSNFYACDGKTLNKLLA